MSDGERYKFTMGGNGEIRIHFHDLTAQEAALLVGGIIGHVYDLSKQSKIIVKICSSPLPIAPNDHDQHS